MNSRQRSHEEATMHPPTLHTHLSSSCACFIFSFGSGEFKNRTPKMGWYLVTWKHGCHNLRLAPPIASFRATPNLCHVSLSVSSSLRAGSRIRGSAGAGAAVKAQGSESWGLLDQGNRQVFFSFFFFFFLCGGGGHLNSPWIWVWLNEKGLLRQVS